MPHPSEIATGFYQGGKTTTFSFDEAGRETRMEVTGEGDGRMVETSYHPSDAIAGRTRFVEGNDRVEEAFAYRTDGLIAQMMRAGGPGNEKNLTYAYDLNGNRTRDERGTHSFNARDQLVLWERGENQPKPGTHVSYVLNGSGAIERELDDGEQTTYRYNGERLLSVEDDETRSTYFYDDFGNVRRISTQSRLDNGVFPDAPAPPSPGYACEQEIAGWSEASDTYYCYDEFERLGASQGPGQDGESYVHDGLDRRDLKLTRDGGARVSEYSYVGTSESLAREQRTDGGAADYDYSASGERMGQRVRDSSSDEFHPYAKDANGSVEALEQDDGSIAEADRYRYDPYGELEDPNEDNDQDADEELGADAESNPFRFQGFYYDSAIKTYDMQAREYRPDVGRFLSADRFEAAGMDLALQSDPLTQNRYAFAGGNPVSRIEFDGHDPCYGSHAKSSCEGGLVRDRKGNTVGTPRSERCSCYVSEGGGGGGDASTASIAPAEVASTKAGRSLVADVLAGKKISHQRVERVYPQDRRLLKADYLLCQQALASREDGCDPTEGLATNLAPPLFYSSVGEGRTTYGTADWFEALETITGADSPTVALGVIPFCKFKACNAVGGFVKGLFSRGGDDVARGVVRRTADDIDAPSLSRPDLIGSPGKGPDVRVVDGDAADTYARLAHGADDLPHPTYDGPRAQLDDGTIIGLRTSDKHGLALDVNPASGDAYRIHFGPGG